MCVCVCVRGMSVTSVSKVSTSLQLATLMGTYRSGPLEPQRPLLRTLVGKVGKVTSGRASDADGTR